MFQRAQIQFAAYGRAKSSVSTRGRSGLSREMRWVLGFASPALQLQSKAKHKGCTSAEGQGEIRTPQKQSTQRNHSQEHWEWPLDVPVPANCRLDPSTSLYQIPEPCLGWSFLKHP